jgi:hypothetical protein
MNAGAVVAVFPPWLLLSIALGALLGAGCKALWPKGSPGLVTTAIVWSAALALGHLLTMVGELGSWRLGDLRPLAGLALGTVLLFVAKRQRVC